MMFKYSISWSWVQDSGDLCPMGIVHRSQTGASLCRRRYSDPFRFSFYPHLRLRLFRAKILRMVCSFSTLRGGRHARTLCGLVFLPVVGRCDAHGPIPSHTILVPCEMRRNCSRVSSKKSLGASSMALRALLQYVLRFLFVEILLEALSHLAANQGSDGFG